MEVTQSSSQVEPFIKNLGKVIVTYRNRAGLSQQQLAENANIALSILQQIEDGRAPANISTISKLACALQLDLSFIMFVAASITPFSGQHSSIAEANIVLADFGVFHKENQSEPEKKEEEKYEPAPAQVFAARLGQLLEDQHLSDSDLARQLNVTRSAVLSWRYARNMPQLKTLRRLAAILGVTTADLIGE